MDINIDTEQPNQSSQSLPISERDLYGEKLKFKILPSAQIYSTMRYSLHWFTKDHKVKEKLSAFFLKKSLLTGFAGNNKLNIKNLP